MISHNDYLDRRAMLKAEAKTRYPYTHHGPAIHGSKLADYLISEESLREDRPELFEEPRVFDAVEGE